MAKPNVQIKREFDPTSMTLEEFINLYMVEGKEQGRPLTNWGSEFKNIPSVAQYLNRPVIDVISEEFWDGPESPLQEANKTAAKTTLANINAKFGAIYENVERQLNRLDKKTRDSVPAIKNLRGSFEKRVDSTAVGSAKETKVAETKFDYRFNPLKMGDFYLAAAEHVKNNPEDGPMIRAFLFNLQTGMRPSEVLNLTDSNIYQPRSSVELVEQARATSRTWLADIYGASTGRPFMTGYIPKTKTLVDAPLSDHALAILGAQQAQNAALEAKYPELKGNFLLRADQIILGRTLFMKDTPEGPKPVTSQDITNVLKKIKVPGIIEYVKPDGTAVQGDTFQSSYDARRMNATTHKLIGTPITVAAQLKGRGVTETGGGREGDYRRLAFGMYDTQYITAQDRLSDFYVGQAEVLFRSPVYQGTPMYGAPLGQNFVPTDLTAAEQGGYILPPPDQKGPPVQLLDSSQGPSRALSPEFRTQVDSVTPDIEVVTDADYEEIYNAETSTTPDPAKPEVPKIEVKGEEARQDLKDRLKARAAQLAGTAKTTGKLGIMGALTGLSYQEGKALAAQEGAGETAQVAAGIGKTLYDIFETTKMLGAGMAVQSEQARAPTEMSPILDTPATRQSEVAQMDRREQVISEQKARIAEYDAAMANRPPETPGSVDDQMGALIKPDIEVTYPNNQENIQ